MWETPEWLRRKGVVTRFDPTAREIKERCFADLRWFVSQPEHFERYAGLVVLLRDREVIGSGRDELEALADAQQRAAQQGKTLPPSHELFSWIVPRQDVIPSFYLDPEETPPLS